jgi:hypothetical protein
MSPVTVMVLKKDRTIGGRLCSTFAPSRRTGMTGKSMLAAKLCAVCQAQRVASGGRQAPGRVASTRCKASSRARSWTLPGTLWRGAVAVGAR